MLLVFVLSETKHISDLHLLYTEISQVTGSQNVWRLLWPLQSLKSQVGMWSTLSGEAITAWAFNRWKAADHPETAWFINLSIFGSWTGNVSMLHRLNLRQTVCCVLQRLGGVSHFLPHAVEVGALLLYLDLFLDRIKFFIFQLITSLPPPPSLSTITNTAFDAITLFWISV